MQDVAVATRRHVVGDRHGVEVARQHYAWRSPSISARENDVAVPLHREVDELTQRQLYVVRYRLLISHYGPVSDATAVSMSIVTALLRHPVLAQHVVQNELVVRVALIETSKHEQARHAEIATREGLHPRRADADRPCGRLTARQLVAALRVEHMGRRGQDATLSLIHISEPTRQ